MNQLIWHGTLMTQTPDGSYVGFCFPCDGSIRKTKLSLACPFGSHLHGHIRAQRRQGTWGWDKPVCSLIFLQNLINWLIGQELMTEAEKNSIIRLEAIEALQLEMTAEEQARWQNILHPTVIEAGSEEDDDFGGR